MDQPSSTESNAIILRIRFKSASLDEFIGRYGADVSPGGIFIRTKQPVEVSTSLQFEFSLADGIPLLSGMGTVAWVRESDPARANNVPGMGLRFDKLTPESQHTHQVILAEKARKEGKASSTPYPPTAFVAPPSRTSPPPEAPKPAGDAAVKADPGPANLAATRPAPAAVVKPATPPAAAVVREPIAADDTDEFSESGKTEISDKPLDYYIKESQAAKEAEEGRRRENRTAEEAIPQSWLEDPPTGASGTPITKSGPPPEGFNEAEHEAAFAEKPEQVRPPETTRKSGSRESFASLLGLGDAGKLDEDQSSVPAGEVLPELSAGVPIEETAPEKTEEVSTLSAAEPLKGPDTLDLGTGLEVGLGDDRPPSRNDIASLKPKRSGKVIAAIAVAAAAAAFGAVYLAKAKPWQDQAKPVAPVAVATPSVKNTPAPLPAPAPANPAAAEEPAAKRPAVEEPKPVVAVAEKADKKEPEQGAEKTEKNDHEKGAAAKSSPEKAVAKGNGESAKSTGKASAKPGAKSEEKSSGAGEEEIYRLVVRSTPIGAEVLIDGEYFSRTPCERRILDPSKSIAVVIRKEGYESHERLVGPSDSWVKKGEERVLTVTASLKKAKPAEPSASPTPAAASTEAKPDRKLDMPLAKPESPSIEAAKAAAVKEPANVAPAAAKPEPAKSAAPTEKPTFKPAPNFDDQGKAKE